MLLHYVGNGTPLVHAHPMHITVLRISNFKVNDNEMCLALYH